MWKLITEAVMRLLFFAGMLLMAFPASGNVLREMSPAEKWKEADAVIVAIPEACPSDLEAPCNVRVVATLKGSLPPALAFARRGLLAEEAASNCCKASHMYLQYLSRFSGVWRPVNGHYGIVDLTAAAGKNRRENR